MAERITAIAPLGAPSPALTESARERAWADFVGGRQDLEVAPSVLDSWVRSRDVFHVDPALERSPIVLPEDEWRRRRERPIHHPLTGETLAVIDVTGYRSRRSGSERTGSRAPDRQDTGQMSRRRTWLRGKDAHAQAGRR